LGERFGPSWALKGSAKVRPLMTLWIYKPNVQQDLRRTIRVATPPERLTSSCPRRDVRFGGRLVLAKPMAHIVAHPLHGAAPLMVLRLHSPDADQAAASGVDPSRRLNLLLTYGGWRENAFADQIPLILNRFGIRCYRAESGDEASDVIRSERVHIAVIDLSIPMHPTRSQPTGTRAVPAGPRVLQLLRRLEQPPPTIVVRPRQVDPAESTRMLADALRDGAFTVLDDPVPIELMLQALERVVRRHYRDHWPAA
jgi:hypothetical protein